MPAVPRARGADARFKCGYNLKQLRPGLHSFLVADDEAVHERCFAHHRRGYPSNAEGTTQPGRPLTTTEFQAAVLPAQRTRLGEPPLRRAGDAKRLIALRRELPGVIPARRHGGTRSRYRA